MCPDFLFFGKFLKSFAHEQTFIWDEQGIEWFWSPKTVFFELLEVTPEKKWKKCIYNGWTNEKSNWTFMVICWVIDSNYNFHWPAIIGCWDELENRKNLKIMTKQKVYKEKFVRVIMDNPWTNDFGVLSSYTFKIFYPN